MDRNSVFLEIWVHQVHQVHHCFFLFGLLVARITGLDLGQLRSFSMFLAAEQESPEVRYKGQLQARMMRKKINALLFFAWKDCGVCLVFSCCLLAAFERLCFTYFVKSVRPCAIWASPIQNPAFRRPGLKCGFVAVPKINSYQLLPIRRVRSVIPQAVFDIVYSQKIHKCITERCFFFWKMTSHVANQGAAQLRWQHEQSSGAPHGESRTVGGGDLRWRVVCRRQDKACHWRISPFFWI